MKAMLLHISEEINLNYGSKVSFKVSRRYCMIVLCYMGYSLILIAKILSCTRQCVAKWISRFEERRFLGLYDRPRSGRPKSLPESTKKIFKGKIALINNEEKTLLCRSADFLFNHVFKAVFCISRATIYRFVKNTNLRKLMPRPVHQKNDPKLMEEWKSKVPQKIQEIQIKNPSKTIKVYFQDESRFGQQTCKYKQWTEVGSRPTYIKQMGYLNSWIYGAVQPDSGEKFGLILPKLNSENMQIFLDGFSKSIVPNTHAFLILDGSRAHKNNILKVPENITLHFLPPYSPELNPIERLWLYVKRNYLSFKLFDSIDSLVDEGSRAWKNITSNLIRSLCRCSYLPKLC